MLKTNFSDIIDRWINDLEKKSFVQICMKPSAASWSFGQVSMHLLEATRHYLEEVSICLSTNDHAADEMSENAKTMFRNNAFPDELIEGPASNSNTPQPESKEMIIEDLKKLRVEINTATMLISASASEGKTKHPGLRYFNAREWFQFAEMHFRHHLRSKEKDRRLFKADGLIKKPLIRRLRHAI